MTNFCSKCGTKLEREYKFCPNCGADVKFETIEAVKGPVVICPNCGEDNSPGNYSCSSCGAALKKGKKEKLNVVSKVKQSGRVPAKKGLDITKLIAIFAGVIGIVLIALIVSGTFEDDIPRQQITNQAPSSGVDLAAMQKINDIEKQVQANPGNYELLLQLAHLKNDSGFFQKAIDDYTKYLEKFPANADARVDMGVCYYNLQQYEPAIKQMEKALEYQPNHQIGHLNLGIVNLAAGNVEVSRKWLQKAADLNPNSDIGKRAQELLKNH